jgi:hypothetical protein
MNEYIVNYPARPIDDHVPGLHQLSNNLYESILSKPTGVSGTYSIRKIDPRLDYDPESGQSRTLGEMSAARYNEVDQKFPDQTEADAISRMSPGGNIPTIVSTQGDVAGSAPAPFTNTNPFNSSRSSTLMSTSPISS